MNLPNKLTLARVILIPIFIIAYLIEKDRAYSNYLTTFIFCLASFTDFLDGYIARKHNLVTDFGKFMDPLADKLLVCSALILFTWAGRLHPFIVIVIVSRDFIISGFRLIAASKGKVIAASYWGKIKTVTQILMIILLLLDFKIKFMTVFTNTVVAIAFVLTVISMVDYIYKNKEFLKTY